MSTLTLPQAQLPLAKSITAAATDPHLKTSTVEGLGEESTHAFSPEIELVAATPTQPESSWLISSPYLEPDHLLDLGKLDIQSSLLAQALTHLEPATPSYATAPYPETLNWATVFTALKDLSTSANHTWTTQIFYVVEFKSKLKEHIDRPLLFDLDKYSHAEANISGGLLKYWYGSPDSERQNLATCKSSFLYLPCL